MNCPECLDLLQGHWDGTPLVPSPELADHLRRCVSCRAMQVGGQVLLDQLQNLPAPQPPLNFSRRLAEAVLADRQTRRQRARRRFRLTAALAASVLLMAVVGSLLLPSRPTLNPVPIDHVQQENHGETLHLAASVADARQAFASLSERLADKAKEQTKLLFSAAPRISMPDMNDLKDGAEPLSLEPAAQSLKKAGREVADGFKPVATTTRQAVAYFFRELPVIERTP